MSLLDPSSVVRRPSSDAEHAHEAAESLARRSYGKLVAFLAARTSDVAGAEDALADAFAAALADWPARGVPEKPEAWLIAVARRKLFRSGSGSRMEKTACAVRRRGRRHAATTRH